MNIKRRLPDSVQVVLPAGWSDIPLDAADREAELQDLAQSEPGLTRADLRQVELLFANVEQLARRYRVIIASGLVRKTPPEESGDADQLVVAGLVASAVGRVDLGTDVPLVADVLIKAFSGRTREGEIEFDEIEPPTKIELAGTTAVKLVRLMRATGSNAAELKQFTQSYLVPVASGDGLIVLQFSTINLEYARQFSELFEKIARTLRILYPDDPTFLDDEATQTA